MKTAPKKKMTREEWLVALTNLLRPVFTDHGSPIPAEVRVSCGFPSSRALSARNKAIGECWAASASADKHAEIFIHPQLDKPLDKWGVGMVLVHELVHAAVGNDCGHKGPFKILARKLHLEGKLTSTYAGDDLIALLTPMVAELGPYPHSALRGLSRAKKKEGTRMLKVECPACGYTVRTTAKWLAVGVPTCPCGTDMVCEDMPEDGGDGEDEGDDD